jgi:hypothetical protein
MDRELSARSRNPKTGEFINYAHPDKDIGKSIFFKRKGMGMLNTDFMAHSFQDRDEGVSEQDLKEALSLDQVIIIPSYEEVYKSHFGTAPPEASTGPRAPQQERSVTRRSLAETDDRQAAGNLMRTPQGEPARNVREPRASKSPDNKCPAGGVMGKDIQSFKECDDCQVWDDCRELERGVPAEEPAKPPATRLALRESARPEPTIGRRARRGQGTMKDEDIPF